MTNVSMQRNIGAYVGVLPALVAETVTAGGGSDGTVRTGLAIDRRQFSRGPILSGKFALLLGATLGGGETATVGLVVQDSADGLAWADYTYLSQAPNAVIDATGNHVVEFDVNLAGARNFIRFRPTVTMSAGSSDAAAISGVFVFTAQEKPIA